MTTPALDNQTPAVMTTDEAARYLRVSPKTVRRLMDRQEIAVCRIGGEEGNCGAVRFRRGDLDAYLARLARASLTANRKGAPERTRTSRSYLAVGGGMRALPEDLDE